MAIIYAISPKNKLKIKIGEVNNRTAMFYITEKRYFQEADAIGIDADIFEKKILQWCVKVVFKLWDGRHYKIRMEDFKRFSWLYPAKDSPEYKANLAVFEPKLVMSIEKMKELDKINHKEESEEMLKISLG